MVGKGTSKDLLDFEDKDMSCPSSALKSTLLVCKDKKKKEAPTSRPTIGPVPKSQFHDKLKGFLGIMAESNKKLEQEAKENPDAFIIEVFTDDAVMDEDEEVEAEGSKYIEMDLMLGVADLKTPEAVKAAEAAIAGNGLAGDSSSDDSDSSDDGEEMGDECSKKRTKIIELS